MSKALEILVTEVTSMNNGHVCVGGWCIAQRWMIRPLSGPREHWDASLAGAALLAVGNCVTITPSSIGSGRGLPHAREDCVVAATYAPRGVR